MSNLKIAFEEEKQIDRKVSDLSQFITDQINVDDQLTYYEFFWKRNCCQTLCRWNV